MVTSTKPIAAAPTVIAPVPSRTAIGQRFDYIDAMRGIAALLVIWAHVTEAFVPLASSGQRLDDVASRLELGRVGVVLFFAISGFVIPFSLRVKAGGGARHALGIFFAHRFFRLFPAYWLSVLVAVIVAAALSNPLPWSTVLANLSMIQTAFGFSDAIGLYWSLRVELVFYALCAMLFLGGVLQRPQWLAAGVIVGIAGYFGGHLLRHAIPPEQWDARLVQFPLYALFVAMMFWGALFRSAGERPREPLGWSARSVLIGFPALIFAMPVVITIVNLWRPLRFGQTVPHAIGIALFLVLATRAKLHGRFGAWLGRISYSLYLFHPIVFGLLLAAATSGMLPAFAQANLVGPLLISTALSIAVAAVVYRYVEAPAIRLGRRLWG